MKRIQHLSVTGLFTPEALIQYGAFILNNLAAGKTVSVYGDPRTREKFKEMIADVVGPVAMAKVVVKPHPNTLAGAMRIGRGLTNEAFLVIEEQARWHQNMVDSIGQLRQNAALLVSVKQPK